MDTTKLVVGQDIYVHNCYGYCKAKVVEVTQSGVNVQTTGLQTRERLPADERVQFDTNGNEIVAGRFGPEPEPWQLDDMPFAERTAWLKTLDYREIGKRLPE